RPVSNSLRGKHCIEVTAGLLSEISATQEVSAGGVTTKSEADGLIGSIGYTYWVENDWGITFSAGVSDADATTSVSDAGTSVISAVVVPMLFGVKYQPSGLLNSDGVRPYMSASIGPYSGFSSEVRTGVTTVVEARSEAALGSRLAVGVDLRLSKWFKLGFAGGYHFVTDFENRIGSEKNYSGPEFSLSLGIVFGKGKNNATGAID
ncbi:MAG: outer membrane beta-barrel protein, partial [Candidatus Zixiibacteriota bacterium]